MLYFICLGDDSPRGQRLTGFFSDPMTEIYLWFFQGVLPIFTSFNLLLQRQDPHIHILYDRMIAFIRKLLGKFVEPRLIKDAGFDLKAVRSIQYEDAENQLNGNKNQFLIHRLSYSQTNIFLMPIFSFR